MITALNVWTTSYKMLNINRPLLHSLDMHKTQLISDYFNQYLQPYASKTIKSTTACSIINLLAIVYAHKSIQHYFILFASRAQ
eukprot:scaffold5965_cov80-Skeletonema_marinoi.AAC.2